MTEKCKLNSNNITSVGNKLDSVIAELNTISDSVSILAKQIEDLKKTAICSSPKKESERIPESLDRQGDKVNKIQAPQTAVQVGPVKRYYSSCSMNSFDASYLLTNQDAINGQGYYEVTDNGDGTGIYQPNTNLAPTLLMNALNMLEPFFDVEHDGSGSLKILSPGRVVRQGKIWQIANKGRVSY